MEGRYSDCNARTKDRWVEEGIEWCIPLSHADFLRARQGDWPAFLMPARPVPRDWFYALNGAHVLGLTGGGFIMSNSISLDNAEHRLLEAWRETTYSNGKY